MANVCQKVKRLMGGNNGTTSFYEKAKATVGSSLGQAAYNYVGEKVPKFAVDASVNSGVRSLVDAVNTGTKSFAGASSNQATRAVFGASGINPDLVPSDPQGQNIFTDAEYAAGVIGDGLISGTIEEADLPGPINQLSALAFIQQNQAQKVEDISDPDCGVTPYARDLIQYAPKHNFMFMVKFVFRSDYNDLGVVDRSNKSASVEGSSEEIKFHYLCRKFTRPEISIDYEDANLYNFHTKVARKVNYSPIDLTLYDDVQNSSMVFLEKYLKMRSPIARKSPEQGDLYEYDGMNYENSTINNSVSDIPGSSASMGGLINENKAVLQTVEVYHIFDYGKRVNKYSFINPKVMEFRLSDFDMDSSVEPASIDINMTYDSMFIETDIVIDNPDIQKRSQLGERFVRKYYSGESNGDVNG